MAEGLLVPGLSVPPTSIPKWNAEDPDWLHLFFEFSNGHVHDDGALIIIYPLRAITKATVIQYGITYSFELMKDWWGTNALHLASPVATGRTNSKPWRGAREKDPRLLQMLIQRCSFPNDIIMDCNVATGASIHACQNLGRHIVALEDDKALFDAVLASMIRTIPPVPKPNISPVLLDDDDDAVEVQVPRIVKKSRFTS